MPPFVVAEAELSNLDELEAKLDFFGFPGMPRLRPSPAPVLAMKPPRDHGAAESKREHRLPQGQALNSLDVNLNLSTLSCAPVMPDGPGIGDLLTITRRDGTKLALNVRPLVGDDERHSVAVLIVRRESLHARPEQRQRDPRLQRRNPHLLGYLAESMS